MVGVHGKCVLVRDTPSVAISSAVRFLVSAAAAAASAIGKLGLGVLQLWAGCKGERIEPLIQPKSISPMSGGMRMFCAPILTATAARLPWTLGPDACTARPHDAGLQKANAAHTAALLLEANSCKYSSPVAHSLFSDRRLRDLAAANREGDASSPCFRMHAGRKEA